MDTVEPRTVGEILGISPADVAGVDLYDIGSEPTSSPRSTSPTRAPRAGRHDIASHLPAAVAGVSDADIAREAGCTPAQLRRARLAQGIRRASGRPSAHAKMTALAMDVFGAPFVPIATKVRSVVDGRFEPPRYLVREKLDFGMFARCVRALRDAGFDVSTIASGIGVREADIERADKIARRT